MKGNMIIIETGETSFCAIGKIRDIVAEALRRGASQAVLDGRVPVKISQQEAMKLLEHKSGKSFDRVVKSKLKEYMFCPHQDENCESDEDFGLWIGNVTWT